MSKKEKNMKAKYLLLTMFWVGILSACTNAETFKDALYFTGTEDSPTVKYTVDGPSEIGVTISASCLAMNDQVVTVKVDSNKLAGYNTLYGKKYKMVPVDDYMLSGNELVLKTGQNISEQLIFFTKNYQFRRGGYLLCTFDYNQCNRRNVCLRIFPYHLSCIESSNDC